MARRERWDWIDATKPRGAPKFQIIKQRLSGGWQMVAESPHEVWVKHLVNVLNRHGPVYVVGEAEPWSLDGKHPAQKK